jgi:hypothetical protein
VNALRSALSRLHTIPYHGGVAQMVERLLSMQEAQGSIPCSSTFFVTCYHRLASTGFRIQNPGSVRRSLNASGASHNEEVPQFHTRTQIKDRRNSGIASYAIVPKRNVALTVDRTRDL